MTLRAVADETITQRIAQLPHVKQLDAEIEARREVLKLAFTVHGTGLTNLEKLEVLRDLGHAGAMNAMADAAFYLEACADSVPSTDQKAMYLRAADLFRDAMPKRSVAESPEEAAELEEITRIAGAFVKHGTRGAIAAGAVSLRMRRE
jgi:hypothetical protein